MGYHAEWLRLNEPGTRLKDMLRMKSNQTQLLFEAIGNGWTVDVIAHILSFLPDELKGKESE